MDAKGIKFRKGSKREAQLRRDLRGEYHIGKVGILPGSRYAKEDEAKWRVKMADSCRKNPPRGLRAISASEPVCPPLLPSEVVFGSAKKRVLDDGSIKLGGEDGEKFNFPSE